jgi:hypothetical protein
MTNSELKVLAAKVTSQHKTFKRGLSNQTVEEVVSALLLSASQADKIAELEKRLIAPTDSGIDYLDYICKVFNNNEQGNLTSLVSSVWNKSRFETLKEGK